MQPETASDSVEFDALGLPWSANEFPFLSALMCFVRKLPGEIAFALGGSFASRRNVALSDLDFFLYVADGDAFAQAETLNKFLGSHQAVVTTCPILHYHSYGYRCSWTLYRQPVSLVELFVTSKLEFKLTEMAKPNRLIIDGSPAYRKYLAASRVLIDDSDGETLDLVLHDLLACAHKTRKGVRSRSLLESANRLYKFRLASLAILVYSETGHLHHPLIGEKYANNLSPLALDVLQKSYQIASVENVDHHFKKISNLIEPGIRALGQNKKISSARAALVIEQIRNYALSD